MEGLQSSPWEVRSLQVSRRLRQFARFRATCWQEPRRPKYERARSYILRLGSTADPQTQQPLPAGQAAADKCPASRVKRNLGLNCKQKQAKCPIGMRLPSRLPQVRL